MLLQYKKANISAQGSNLLILYDAIINHAISWKVCRLEVFLYFIKLPEYSSFIVTAHRRCDQPLVVRASVLTKLRKVLITQLEKGRCINVKISVTSVGGVCSEQFHFPSSSFITSKIHHLDSFSCWKKRGRCRIITNLSSRNYFQRRCIKVFGGERQQSRL